MAYFYYSDNPTVEAIEYYCYWPLRRLGYHVPGFTERHYLERTPVDPPPRLEDEPTDDDHENSIDTQ